VDHQRLGIANIRQVRDQLQMLDEALSGRSAALDTKREDGTTTFG
jgi:hypothetical protein